ncbi:hypothetical protein ILUMI_07469 [Ignelater luminosus]|uniref:Uncharacterized protein n=1 Tax=Ignelater luminosus TaxID=2038154 RepID=A0A8K0DDG0_IGNLU|nr:hypothetical protein ILUMI_07469 [Ignelater luminosus]
MEFRKNGILHHDLNANMMVGIFLDIDIVILEQIIDKRKSTKLCRRLTEKTYALKEELDLARAMENAEGQAATMEEKKMEILSNCKALSMFQSEARIQIITDAGPEGLAYVLTQTQTAGRRILTSDSRSLRDGEKVS